MTGPCTSGFWRWMVLVLIASTDSVTGQGGFTVRAQSTGIDDPGAHDINFRNSSYIVSNGQTIRVHQDVYPYGRGHQAFVLNELTGGVIDKAVFDTQGGGAYAATQLTTFLEGVEAGRIIAIVVHNSSPLFVNLAPYGSTITATALGFRESYAMITQKGAKPSWFVEEKTARYAGPTIVEAYIPLVCPSGYRLYRDGCYRFWGGRNAKSYSGARQVCQQNGGDIYMWRDADAVARLTTELIRKDTPSLWIGLSDEDLEGTWLWADGMALGDFNDWFADPSVNTYQKNCAVARKLTQYRWSPASCSNRRAFICYSPSTP